MRKLTFAAVMTLLSFVTFSENRFPEGRRHENIKGKELVYLKEDIDGMIGSIHSDSRTNRYPMFIIDLNTQVQNLKVVKDGENVVDIEYPDSSDKYSYTEWTDFELKASTNNYYVTNSVASLRICRDGDETEIVTNIDMTVSGTTNLQKMVFYGLSNLNLEPNKKIGTIDPPESMRKYSHQYNVKGLGTDGRSLTFYDVASDDLTNMYPSKVVVILDPTKFKRTADDGWCNDRNHDIIWTFIRGNVGQDGDSRGNFEKDDFGNYMWHPIKPVCWLPELPRWAYTNNEVRIMRESQYNREKYGY